MEKIVLFSANRGYALLSSRKELIQRFLDHGWCVVLATADDDEAHELVDLGAQLEPVQFTRGGFSLIGDYKAYRRLLDVIVRWKPSLVHFFHAKPVIMGTLAAGSRGRANAPSIVNTITGLGQAFVKGGLVTSFASAGYRKALSRADITIFQNPDDMELFVESAWLSSRKARLIAGSGVPLNRFSFVERSMRSNEKPVIVMLGRLLKQKGIPEFVQIAAHIRQRLPGARFVLAGEEEVNHVDGVSMSWLRSSADIEYVGRLSDVIPLMAQADLLLFPSYYREGVPRVVMEAAATGLPTVAFDVPGVREAVRNDQTGFLVPDRNVEQMTERVFQLLEDKGLRLEMGRKASELAKEAFDIRAVQEAYLNVYRELGVDI